MQAHMHSTTPSLSDALPTNASSPFMIDDSPSSSIRLTAAELLDVEAEKER